MEDDNGNPSSSSSSFMMEMSQDCIVWDESKNRDLREIAISPMNDTSSVRPNNQSAPKDISNTDNRLDSIKRRLGGVRSSEQEVDAVFRFLEDEEGTSQTQPTGNSRNVRPKLSSRPQMKMKTSLASRHRRKQRAASSSSTTTTTTTTSDADNHIMKKLAMSVHSNRRRRRVTTDHGGGDGLFASPVPTGIHNNRSAAAEATSADLVVDGSFEELLKEFATPQSTEKKRASIQEEQESHIASSMPPPRSTSQNTLPPVPLPTQTSSSKEPTISSTNVQPTRPLQQPNQTTRSAAPPIANHYPRILPKPGTAKENQASHSSQTMRLPTNMSPNRKALRNTNTNQPPTSVVPKSSMPPPSIPPPSASAATFKRNETTTKNDDDENFEDFDFGDISNLDSLLSMKSSTQVAEQQPLQANPKPAHTTTTATTTAAADVPACKTEAKITDGKQEEEDEFGHFPDVDFDATTTDVPACKTEVKITDGKQEEEDEFGHFLDVDFDATTTDVPACKTEVKITDGKQEKEDEFGHFPDVDFDATTTAVPACKTEVKITDGKQEKEDEFGHFPDVDFDAIDAVMQKTSPPVTVQHPPELAAQQPQAPVVDEFGDFPDMDFDVIDQVIAQRSTQEEPAISTVTTPPSVTSMACHLPPNGAVKNPRRATLDADLSFISFTRYKIVDVVDDTASYTKTLSVAPWTDAMRKEQELEKDFHRNCEVTESSDSHPQGSTSSSWKNGLHDQKYYKPDGLLHLRGEWYHTPVSHGDVLHLCSVSGRFRTDAQALPIVLHNPAPPGSDNDDLVLVIHPDILMTPTTISETVTCSRRAVLKSRIGSTGLSSKAPLFGTMRHDLFGLCMRQENFDLAFAKRNVHKLARQNAEGLLGCGVSTAEAQEEILKVFPVIRDFVAEYTALGKPPSPELLNNGIKIEGHGYQSNIKFLTHKVHSIEEPIISPELALKGNVDAVLEANTLELNDKPYMPNPVQNPVPQHSLMCLELKTGHNQNPHNAHMAQLALYTLMLQSRYGWQRTRPGAHLHGISEPNGASAGGILLYLNQQGTRSAHVSPLLNEAKSLVGQRNIVASGLHRASRPRGVVLSYGDGTRGEEKQTTSATLLPPPPADLPEVMSNSHSCQRCYVNRECMLYAAAETRNKTDPNWLTGRSHADLLAKFTGNLQESDMEYFRKWDRLIDLEADASSRNMATAWLTDSHSREKERGESVSGLVFDHPEPSPTQEGSRLLIAFRRGGSSPSQAPFQKIALSRGCHVIISTDGTSLVDSSHSDTPTPSPRRPKRFRHQMHIVRGIVEKVENEKLFVMARREDLERIRDLVTRHRKFCEKNGGEAYSPLPFRFDKDTSSVGIGTLRQNLINFLTADFSRKEVEQMSQASVAKQSRLPKLRDIVVRLASPKFDLRVTPDSIFRAVGPEIPGCDMDTLSAEYSRLNPDQQQAVIKVVSASDYTLIQGLPGTGKTTTLAYVARLLAARGKRVLITSYTHAAVDNVVLKLMEKGVASVNESTPVPRLVRIGQRSSCHTRVRSLLASELALQLDRIQQDRSEATMHTLSQTESYQNFDNPSVESLKEVVSAARIVCSSALSVPRTPLLIHEDFDVVIIDEAGQISQPAILGALVAADSFVLVGDHQQLPPLVTSQLAETGGYGVSMLQRLAEKHPQAIASLTYQYRMNMAICRLSSEAVYGGRLKCGSEEVKSRTLQMVGFPCSLPQASSKSVYPWLKSVVDPQKSVVFVDTDNIKKNPRPSHARRPSNENGMQAEMEALEGNIGGRSGGNVINQTEVSLIRIILQGLFSCGVSPTSVGVISPFRAQLRILEDDSKIASWKADGLELSTIDRYQGRDKEVIILSSVRSNPAGKVGRLLLDMRRLNVALTRAKSKLIILGSFSTLSSGSDPLRPLLGRVNKRGQRFLLPENAVQCYNI